MIKTLDRYVIRTFANSYLLCFGVMMGMRVIADLFVNIDEFAELTGVSGLAAGEVVAQVAAYYLYNLLVYFQELGGVILTAAAAFALARMNHTNELSAILASGVSLHRVILPILLVACLLCGVGAVNQEVLIPRYKDRLVRHRDQVPGTEKVKVSLLNDDRRQVWYSRELTAADGRMESPPDPRARRATAADRPDRRDGGICGRCWFWFRLLARRRRDAHRRADRHIDDGLRADPPAARRARRSCEPARAAAGHARPDRRFAAVGGRCGSARAPL